jgi:16S rRNA (guanine527-N7)-methyltransferase
MSPLSRQQILTVLNSPKLELEEVRFSDDVIERFQEFCTLLQKWNDKINLTSEKNALSILEKHVFDSLHYLPWLDSSHNTLDIGSGAGFPGIPLKIIYPDLNLTLMDSQRKRCNFMREVIRALKLDLIDVVDGRAENFFDRENFSEEFDRVLFRGFGSLGTCLAIGLPFLKSSGQMILKKNPQEMPDSTDDIVKNARIIESKSVEALAGQDSLMMVIEKCST